MTTGSPESADPADPGDPGDIAGPAVLAFVGAGPRATGLLERIAANAPGLWPPGRELVIHLIDPHPPGAGRVWRHEQSPLLRMNSMAEDVTMFTDESSTLEGPVRKGPSLAEWAAQFRNSPSDGPGSPTAPRYEPYAEPQDPAVLAELRALAPTGFPTRRAQSAYLDWVHRRAVAGLPAGITVHSHRDTALDVAGGVDERQRVRLAGRAAPLVADMVVLTQGHLGAEPAEEHRELADFARRHGRFYQPPEFSADADLSGLRPGEEVILRGLGLAFVDLTTLLTEGRGGRYEPGPDGELTYRPSGREPVIHAGSRRGVPYHSKTGYRLGAERPPLPRYFGPEAVDALIGGGSRLPHGPAPTPLELRRDVWPSMAKEIGYGHYHELFHAHPERTALPWQEFIAAYDGLDWYAPAMTDLIAAAVPHDADRLDFEALDRPLSGAVFAGPAEFQEHLRSHIAADAARRADPRHSADLGAFLALLSVYGQLPRLVASGRLSARSLAQDLDGWWQGFFSFLASGPPGFRLRELLALSRAGVLHFTGPRLNVTADEATGEFTASSPAVPGHVVRATALVEAYQPRPTLARTRDPLLRTLHRAGRLSEETVGDASYTHRSGLVTVLPETGSVLDPALGGAPHPRRAALGAHTDSRAVAAFARPRTNAPAFRQNDSAARALLRALARFGTGTAEGGPEGGEAGERGPEEGEAEERRGRRDAASPTGPRRPAPERPRRRRAGAGHGGGEPPAGVRVARWPVR